jgi:hypothetical protein
MKKVFTVMLCIFTAGYSGLQIGRTIGMREQKHKNFKAERYAAEWGCLQASMSVCPYVELGPTPGGVSKYDCENNMLENVCPERADAFEKFMSQSLPHE